MNPNGEPLPLTKNDDWLAGVSEGRLSVTQGTRSERRAYRPVAAAVLALLIAGISATAYAALRGEDTEAGAGSSAPPAASRTGSRPPASPSHTTRPAPARVSVPGTAPTAAKPGPVPTTAAKPKAGPVSKPAVKPKPTKAWRSRTITGTSVLTTGQSWASNRLRLSLTGTGDLTLSDRGTVTWRTRTANRGAERLVMQADGNLVLYDGAGGTVWSTRTEGHGGAVLTLRADGDMSINLGTGTLWHTGTGS